MEAFFPYEIALFYMLNQYAQVSYDLDHITLAPSQLLVLNSCATRPAFLI